MSDQRLKVRDSKGNHIFYLISNLQFLISISNLYHNRTLHVRWRTDCWFCADIIY
jgi:hypothetical protein